MWSGLGPSHANIVNSCDAARPCASRFGIGGALIGGSPCDLTPKRQDAQIGETIARYATLGVWPSLISGLNFNGELLTLGEARTQRRVLMDPVDPGH